MTLRNIMQKESKEFVDTVDSSGCLRDIVEEFKSKVPTIKVKTTSRRTLKL